GGDQDLLASPVRDVETAAALVEELAALDAQARLERPGRIVKTRMDHAAVAAGGLLANAAGLFPGRAPPAPRPPERRAPPPRRPCSNDCALDIVHGAFRHHTSNRFVLERWVSKRRGFLMRVLVTGHRGYIGVEMVPYLRKHGHQIVGLDVDYYDGNDFGGPPD